MSPVESQVPMTMLVPRCLRKGKGTWNTKSRMRGQGDKGKKEAMHRGRRFWTKCGGASRRAWRDSLDRRVSQGDKDCNVPDSVRESAPGCKAMMTLGSGFRLR